MYRKVRILLVFVLLSTVAHVACSQGTADFSGQWKLDNDRSEPKRSGDVTLRVEHHAPELTVETWIVRSSASPRHAMQRYTTDGKVSLSTGADGDQFKTSVAWKDSSLVFSIEEHEDGRILLSTETWSILDDGATLKRVREPRNGEKQTRFFRRIPTSSSSNKSGLAEAQNK